MRASVVIPAYNARASLGACLDSLNHQRLASRDEFNVVVVDDGSDDGTSEFVSTLAVDYEIRCEFIPRTELSGRSRARNRGISIADGDLVIFVDADQIMPPDFVSHHIRSHTFHRDLVLVGPRHILTEGADMAATVDRMLKEAVEHPPVSSRDNRERFWAALSENLNDLATCWHFMFTCNVSVRAEHLLGVGGFDEGFSGWGLEDSELGYRLRKRGLSFAYNPHAMTYHEYVAVPAADLYYAEWRQNLSYFTSKHRELDSMLQWVLDRSFDPEGDLKPLESVLRFEYAVRALDGRMPYPSKWSLIEITEETVSEGLEGLPERIASGPCVIFDWTDDADLPIRVQTAETTHDLMYFRAPDQAVQERLRERFGVSPASRRTGRGA